MVGLGDQIKRVTDDDRITGVRGWLLLPPVIVALYILGAALGIPRLLISGQIATTAGSIEATISAAIAAFGGLCIWMLMKEKRRARVLMIIFFVIASALNLLMLLGLLQTPDANPLSVVAGIRDVLACLGIIVYFLISRRVKLTLVN